MAESMREKESGQALVRALDKIGRDVFAEAIPHSFLHPLFLRSFFLPCSVPPLPPRFGHKYSATNPRTDNSRVPATT